MATGHGNQLTKQLGEYLVACELARRGLLVATFSGSVPDFDLIATDTGGRSCPVQVKTSTSGAWHFKADRFARIRMEGDRQVIEETLALPVPHLVCVFVIAGVQYGADQFFVLAWSQVQEIVIANHARWLAKHGGVRPKRPDSMQVSLPVSDIQAYRDHWELFNERL